MEQIKKLARDEIQNTGSEKMGQSGEHETGKEKSQGVGQKIKDQVKKITE
jgi:hypothetical protein